MVVHNNQCHNLVIWLLLPFLLVFMARRSGAKESGKLPCYFQKYCFCDAMKKIMDMQYQQAGSQGILGNSMVSVTLCRLGKNAR